MVRDKSGRFVKGDVNFWKGKHLAKEAIEKRTKTRRKNGWFKDLNRMKELSKRGYEKILKCPDCKCFISKDKEHNCKEIWDKIDTKFKEGCLNKNKGKTYEEIYGHNKSTELRKKLSISHPSEKSALWMGGISKEPYGKEFNNLLREQIRERDNFTCQECSMTEKQLGYTLSIHHIDYNKKNNSLDNLITLCKSCHNQTNFNRNDWTGYFKDKINGGKNG